MPEPVEYSEGKLVRPDGAHIGSAALSDANTFLTVDSTQAGTVGAPTATRQWSFQPVDTAKAPFGVYMGGASFSSQWDTVMYEGYNPAGAVVAEPRLTWNVEQDYLLAGTHYMECYWEFHTADGSFNVRPFFFQAVRDNTGTVNTHISMGYGASDYISFEYGSGTQVLKVNPTSVSVAVAAYPFVWTASGAKTMLKAVNNAASSTLAVLQANTSDVLRIGDNNSFGHTAINLECYNGAARILQFNGLGLIPPSTVGLKIGTSTSHLLGFWNATPVVQQVLATGAAHTVDDVITLLQTLGLVKQS